MRANNTDTEYYLSDRGDRIGDYNMYVMTYKDKNSEKSRFFIGVVTLIVFLIGFSTTIALLIVFDNPSNDMYGFSYYIYIRAEHRGNITLYLPLPNLSDEDTDKLISDFYPTNEEEYNKYFSPFLDIGYNKTFISKIDTESGKFLEVVTEGSTFISSSIDIEGKNFPYPLNTLETMPIWVNKSNQTGNLYIKLFLLAEAGKKGIENFNYHIVEYLGTSSLDVQGTPRFTYISELKFLNSAEPIPVENGWTELKIYKGKFEVNID